jgi:hypothetical protein
MNALETTQQHMKSTETGNELEVHFFLYSWYMLPFILILVILVLGSLAWWT